MQLALWERIEGADKVGGLKLLIWAIIDLGLHRATWPTLGMITTVYHVLREGQNATMEKSQSDKWSNLQDVKTIVKPIVAEAPAACVYVSKLPPDVCRFEAMYPSLAKAFYAEDKKTRTSI